MGTVEMLRGRAAGGPRAGVMLEAAARWDGYLPKYPAGRYRWEPVTELWIWELVPLVSPRPPVVRRRRL